MLNKSKIIFFSSILALTSISPNFNFIKANSFDSETKVIKSFFGDNVFSNIEGYTSKKVTEDCGIKHIVKDTLLKDLGTVEEHTRIDSLEVNLDTISDSSNDKSLCEKIKDKFGLDVVYAGDKSTTSNKSDSSGTAKITITKDEIAAKIKDTDSTLSANQINALANAVYAQVSDESAIEVQQGTVELNDTGKTIANGASQALGGLKQVQIGMPTITKGAEGVATGLSALSGNMEQLGTITATVADGSTSLKEGVGQLQTGIGALQAGAKKLHDNSSTLNAGLTTLKDGGSQLASGVSQLASGANQVADGAGTLAGGTQTLLDGANTLADGNQTLADGMQEYKEEAIDKLTDLFNGDISGVTDRIDAMTNLAKEYKSFAGISDGVSGTTKFIIETEGIDD